MRPLLLNRVGVFAGSHPPHVEPPPPFIPMDHLADAMFFPDESGTLTWDNTDYDAAPEVGTIVGHDGWLVFIPNVDCMVHLDTIGSAADTHIIVWMGIDASPTPPDFFIVAQDDDGGGGSTSSLTFLAQGGRRHWVQVGMHFTHTPVTNMALAWSGIDYHSSPVYTRRNDDLAQALTIIGTGSVVKFSNWDYTSESGEVGPRSSRSAWYYFRPGSDGLVSLDTQMFTHDTSAGGLTTDTDTLLELFQATRPDPSSTSSLQLVASNDDGGTPSGTSVISGFPVTADVDYFVRVVQYRPTGFNFNAGLNYSIPVAPVPTFTDTFQRANGPIGNGWASLYGTAVILTHKAVCQSQYATYGRDSGSADVSVTAGFLRGTDPASSCYALARASDADNGFKFGYQANTGQLVCYSTVAGVPTSLLTVGASIGPGEGFFVQLVITGSTIRCYFDGDLVGTAAVPGGSSTGHLVGFQISEPGGTPDTCNSFSY